MTGEAIAGELVAKLLVLASFIGHHACPLGDVLAQDRRQCLGGQVVDLHGAHLAALAINEGQHVVLVCVAATLLDAFGLDGAVVADERLVHFDRAAVAAHGRQIAGTHGFADAMSQEPRGLVGDAQHAVQLMGADALLAGAHEIDRLERLVERDMGALEDGADLDRELLAAIGALAKAKAGLAKVIVLAGHGATMGALHAVRPHHAFKVLGGGFVAVKVAGGQGGHGLNPCPHSYLNLCGA